jgi:hypothetical protein
MALNSLSGRSWLNLSAFPILPWTFIDFTSSHIALTNVNDFRNFGWPIFAQTANQIENCQKYFTTTSHHFPSYVSNQKSVSYFLMRLEPFTNDAIDLQIGNFDRTERTFESVPEIYFLPEIFLNVNENTFSSLNVSLPEWTKNATDFVRKMRKALEGEITTNSLNEWIDLIFGFRQRGPLAIARCNIFPEAAYSLDKDTFCIGEVPLQLFGKLHPRRRFKSSSGRVCLISSGISRCDPHDIGWKTLPNNKRIRISGSALELWVGEFALSYPMSDDIRPICLGVDGMEAVSGHYLPIANHWRASDCELEHLGVLRGRHARITSVCLTIACKAIVVGYADGGIAIFCSIGHEFLRTIESHTKEVISHIVCRIGKAEIFTFQIWKGTTIISRWSLNGSFLTSEGIEGEIKDVRMRGMEKDALFLMIRNGMILTINPTSLTIRSTIEYAVEFAEGVMNMRKETLKLRTSTREATFKIVKCDT